MAARGALLVGNRKGVKPRRSVAVIVYRNALAKRIGIS